MKRSWQFIAAVFVAALPLGAAAQGIQYDKIELIPETFAPNLTMLAGNKDVDPGHPDGAGGRIGVLHGPDGILVVDSQYGQIADKVMVQTGHAGSIPAARSTFKPNPDKYRFGSDSCLIPANPNHGRSSALGELQESFWTGQRTLTRSMESVWEFSRAPSKRSELRREIKTGRAFPSRPAGNRNISGPQEFYPLTLRA